jgi:YegS/Rv2252/BmrU family lipid kinase
MIREQVREVTPIGTMAVIVNRTAGRGLVRQRENRIVDALKAAGFELTLFHTMAEGHATELAQDAAREGFDTIVAVGGDGTVHEVAAGMWASEATLGVIPCGSGNDFAASQGIPSDIDAAVAVLADGVVGRSDVGLFGEYCFFNTIALGFAAAVTVYSRRHRRLRGYLLYLVTVLQSLFMYRSIPMVAETDGFRRDDLTYMITVGIGNREGGGFRVVPNAVTDDGMFEICIIHDVSIPTALRYLPVISKGEHTDLPIITMLDAPRIHISTDEPILLHADGQVYQTGVTELEVSCQPRALKVRLPA